MSSNLDLISYLLLLRFGNVSNKSKLSPKISYSSIAKLVKISIESVLRLISKGINDLQKKQEIQPHLARNSLKSIPSFSAASRPSTLGLTCSYKREW